MIILISLFLFASESPSKTITYNKVPKSLFLIKKAKIESDVGEPSLPFFDKQRQTILEDERLSSND